MIKLFVLLIVTYISFSDACSCIYQTPQKQYCDSAYAAVIYTINSGSVSGTTRTYGISVLLQFKGVPINPTQLQTSFSSASCGITLTPGNAYIVATASSSPLSANSCGFVEPVGTLTVNELIAKIQAYKTSSCPKALRP